MRPTTQYSLTRISTNISGDQLGIYLLPLCHTHPVPTGRCKWFKHIRCCGFSHFGATVAVGEGQDLVNLEDPSVQVTENKNTAKASMLFYPIGTHDRALISNSRVWLCLCIQQRYIVPQESLKTPFFLLSNEELFKYKMCILGLQCTTVVHNLDVGVAGLDT